MRRLILIDGINFFYRGSWTGISNEMKSIQGEDMSYVLAYFRNLSNLIGHFKYKDDDNRYVICWDGGYDERLRISSEAVSAGIIPKAYKQERRESHDIEDPEEKQKAMEFMRQMKKARELTNYTIVSQMWMKGEEADDIIGSYSVKYADGFDEILMVTTDRDYFQLLTPKVKMYNSGKNEYRDLDYIKREYNLDKASQWIDVGALAGESGASSDTIYGVPGIGYKTAAKLISEYGTLDELINKTSVELAPDVLKCGNDIMKLYNMVKDKSYRLNHHKKELAVLAHNDIVQLARKLKSIRTFLDVELADPNPSWNELDTAFKSMGLSLGRFNTDILTDM